VAAETAASRVVGNLEFEVKADRPEEQEAETAATTAAYSSEDVVTADRTAAATATTTAAAQPAVTADKAAVEPTAEKALIQGHRNKIYGTFGTRAAEENEVTADQEQDGTTCTAVYCFSTQHTKGNKKNYKISRIVP
jgi:hypothetical protein